MRILAVLGLSVLTAGAGASRQAAPPQPPQQPSFHVSTDVVAVDVAVIGRDGAPVTGLQPGDFSVRVDGQPRRIVSMQFIDQSTSAAPAAAAGPTSTATFLHVSSNQAGGAGRLILILVDQQSIPFGQLRVAAESVGQLLAGFGPGDRFALATLPGPRMVVNFGADRQRIVDAVKAIPGSAVARHLTDLYEMGYSEAFRIDGGDQAMLNVLIERSCGAALRERDAASRQQELEACIGGIKGQANQMAAEARQQSTQFAGALRTVLSGLGSVDAPKAVIVVSTGFVAPEARTEFAFLASASAVARTAIYAVHLDRGLFDITQSRAPGSLFEDREAALSGLEAVAGRARGSVVTVTRGAESPFARLVREMSAYYLIGIETTTADRDGKAHRIAVETAKPGLTVRARPEFTLAPAPPAKAKARANAVDELETVTNALTSPLSLSTLPVRMATFNMADDDPARVRVMMVAEIDRDQPKDDDAAIGYTILDAQGNAVAGFSRRLPLEKAPTGALTFVSVASVRPGSYTAKLAAVHGGQVGSVEHRFAAVLTSAGSLRLGDLIVGDPVQAQEKIMTPSLETRLRGDRIWAFVQLGRDPAAPGEADLALEIAKRADGPALLSAPLVVEASGNRVGAAQVNLDARLLPPGDYVARLRVTGAGKPLGTISTGFAFERRHSSAVPSTASPVAGIAGFNPQEVLEPAVLDPFLEDLRANATEANQAAIDNAKAGRFQAAVKQLGPARADDPLGPFIRGLALFASGQLQPASDAFRQAIAAAPDFMVGAFYIGACYAAGGKEQQAIGAWQMSLVGLDRYPIVYRVLGDALLRAGQATRAADLLAEAQTRWPDDERFGMRLAQAGSTSGRYDQAAPTLDRMIARQPGNADLLFLAMQSAFESAVDATGPPPKDLLSALKRYRGMYVAANGPRQALVAEWVSFLESRAK